MLTAGLPNIIGSFRARAILFSETGAFNSLQSDILPENSEGGNYGVEMGFDASLCNKIYGKAETVQSPALILLPQIKY